MSETSDDALRAAKREAWNQGAQMARNKGWLVALAANPYRDRPRPDNPCACGSLSLDDSASDRHDRGLHGPNECNYPTFTAAQSDDRSAS